MHGAQTPSSYLSCARGTITLVFLFFFLIFDGSEDSDDNWEAHVVDMVQL